MFYDLLLCDEILHSVYSLLINALYVENSVFMIALLPDNFM